jgi:glycine cleavage system H protein
MKTGEYEIHEGIYYTETHEWMKIEKDKCRIGISDFAQKSLHDIVFVDLPRVGAKIDKGQPLGAVESVKAVADVFAPISSEILETNAVLEDKPELLNQEPYKAGWIVLARGTNLDEEISSLMNAESYGEYLKLQE